METTTTAIFVQEEMKVDNKKTDLFKQILDVIQEGTCDAEEVENILVKGKKRVAKTDAQKKKVKALKLREGMDERFNALGFGKEHDHSGAFTQYSMDLPAKQLSAIKTILKEITSDSLFNYARGTSDVDHSEINRSIH